MWLPERECSVQRRNQKVIEEAPSVAMDQATRKKMGEQALALARSCDYHTTGTVEFLMDKNKDFYFLEMNTRLQVEHPITEEITGIDLVEQQILISAGHKLQMKQDDVKINGHSVEYRVYAEDPSRKFLPSIGFLKKYREPEAHPHVRIDTGVQEGSEISMYYDPMISKLITWAPDRKQAMTLMDNCIDEYVVQGVAHNLGFGQSIINNESFAKGDYSTAFIDQFYPEGYRGDALDKSQMDVLAMAAHQQHHHGEDAVQFMTILGDESDTDLRIESKDGALTVTHLQSGEEKSYPVSKFEFLKQCLIKLTAGGDESTLQYLGKQSELNHSYYFKGGQIKVMLFDERQWSHKHHMAPPTKIDYSRSIMSPMPGAIVSVSVEVGQTVSDGQELCVIEAMKMQNILKSERDGVIKAVNVVAGDSVAVDELLIEFE